MSWGEKAQRKWNVSSILLGIHASLEFVWNPVDSFPNTFSLSGYITLSWHLQISSVQNQYVERNLFRTANSGLQIHQKVSEMIRYRMSVKCPPPDTYRELPSVRIKANMDGVFKVWGRRNDGFIAGLIHPPTCKHHIINRKVLNEDFVYIS